MLRFSLLEECEQLTAKREEERLLNNQRGELVILMINYMTEEQLNNLCVKDRLIVATETANYTLNALSVSVVKDQFECAYAGDFICWKSHAASNMIQIFNTKSQSKHYFDLNRNFKFFGRITLKACDPEQLFRSGMLRKVDRASYDALADFLQISDDTRAIIIDLTGMECTVVAVIENMPSLCHSEHWAETPFKLKKRVEYETNNMYGKKEAKIVELDQSRLGNFII